MNGTDWIRCGVPFAGMERIEAQFSGHAYDPHRHDDYAIGYTISGHQSFRYRGTKNDSFLGQTIVIHPDEMHDGRAGSHSGFRYRMIYVPPRLVLEAMPEGLTFLPFAPTPVVDDDRLLGVLRGVFSDVTEPLNDLAVDAFLTELSDALLQRHGGFVPKRQARYVDMPALRRVAELLREGYRKTATSDQLERLSNLNRFQLARQFKRLYGTTPDRFRLMRMLERGRRLLLAGVPLAEAAVASGFADQPHFTRQFAHIYGMTPGRWRCLTRSMPKDQPFHDPLRS